MKHSEILKTITKQTGSEPTQKEIADTLGLTRNAISSRAFRDKEYSVDELEKISKAFGVDLLQISWVKSKLSESDNSLEQIKNEILNKRLDYLEQKDSLEIDYYPEVFGSCGTGVFVPSETKERMEVPKRIIKNFSTIKKYSVINAYGDSMQPFIQDKDLLVVEHYNGEQIKDNRVYVFRFGDKIFVKRLVLNINQLIIKSDNREYEPIKIELDNNCDVQIIGQIVGLMRGMA